MSKQSNLETRIRETLGGQSFLTRLEEQGIKYPAPWFVVSSRELATAFQIHLQTVANWQIRGQGPQAEPKGVWRGNRTYFTIANIIGWLEEKEPAQVYHEWYLEKYTNADELTLEECETNINKLVQSRAYKQPKWKRKKRMILPEFKFDGRATA